MTESMPPIIEVSGLVKSFAGQSVLAGVDLRVARGELVSIIGPSGCGKSTLLRCINGLEAAEAGTVRVDDATLHAEPGRGAFHGAAHRLRERVGLLFQSLNLFPHLSALDNVALAPTVVRRKPREEARRHAAALLAKVGLAAHGDKYPHQLSGGQQQRAAIARALAMEPEVMLYDEPTSALDPELVDEVLEVMRALHAEGMTQVVVTHEMRFAREASDRIIYMEAGRFIEEAPGDGLFVAPKDERTRRYLRKFWGGQP